MKQEEEKCCGNCCWFCYEDTDGYGQCLHIKRVLGIEFEDFARCSDDCRIPDTFVSRQEMRHHMAVLLQANRYRRDDNVPPIYRMPKPTEIGEAIDFAYGYMKVFSEL